MSYFLNRKARGWGQRARQRRIERTGKDPADNPVNNGFNRWASRHPLGLAAFWVLLGVLFVAAIALKVSV